MSHNRRELSQYRILGKNWRENNAALGSENRQRKALSILMAYLRNSYVNAMKVRLSFSASPLYLIDRSDDL